MSRVCRDHHQTEILHGSCNPRGCHHRDVIFLVGRQDLRARGTVSLWHIWYRGLGIRDFDHPRDCWSHFDTILVKEVVNDDVFDVIYRIENGFTNDKLSLC